jgi:putative protease
MSELLAPAGSIESFHAAVEAGADAVYLGLSDFNARLRAKNFTVKTLSYLVPYAHRRSVKIYVTLNTLIKQSEIENLIHTLYQLEQIGIDAIIAADLGLAEIAKKHFPKLRLHASTQMAIHNSAGMKAASKLGFTRAVLARELSIREITMIKNSSSLELEVFIHGALCYSISGLCLASSFLGGASGNRGRCTQVCRRKFNISGTAGYFFSPDDFCALKHLSSLLKAGVSSLKIEGRMKGPEYVHIVVSAYRKFLDDPEKISEAGEMLINDLGRPKTSLFLDGLAKNPINPDSPSGTGIKLGEVLECGDDLLRIDCAQEISSGDRIRIHAKDGFEGMGANVLHAETVNGILELKLKTPVKCSKGDMVFLVSRRSASSRFDSSWRIDSDPVPFKPFFGPVKSILRNFAQSSTQRNRSELWVKIDDTGWLEPLMSSPCSQLVFTGDYDRLTALLEDSETLRVWRSRLRPSLPPFIREHELGCWRKLIRAFSEKGINRWNCTNPGQVFLFPEGTDVSADNPVWALNRFSQRALEKLGFSAFSYSLEDEYLNIRNSSSPKGIICLFSRVPLFVSCIKPGIESNRDIFDPHRNCFFIEERNGLYYTLSKETMCLFQRKKKLQEAGINRFLIDLSFIKPEEIPLQELIAAYKSGEKIPDSGIFNFKAGLK